MGASLTILDYCMIALFIPAIISGLIKGFIEQAASLLALLAGIWAAYSFSDLLSPYLKDWFGTESSMVNLLSFIVIFIVILILGRLAGKLASKLMEIAMLGWIDKLLGVVFAILKTALILSVLIYILNSLDHYLDFLPKWTISQSKFYLFLQDIAPKIFPYFRDLPGLDEIVSAPAKAMNI